MPVISSVNFLLDYSISGTCFFLDVPKPWTIDGIIVLYILLYKKYCSFTVILTLWYSDPLAYRYDFWCLSGCF